MENFMQKFQFQVIIERQKIMLVGGRAQLEMRNKMRIIKHGP